MEDYIRERITTLRIKKGVSEYQMSYDLGHSRSYINNITSGKTLPSVGELISICDYFGIEPKEFFDIEMECPELVKAATDEIKRLDDEGLRLIIGILKRMNGSE